MTTNIVRKLGVLLVLSLVIAVCCGAGAAAPESLYKGSVDIVDSTYLAPEKGGYKISTDLGVLALAASAGSLSYFTVDVENNNYNITDFAEFSWQTAYKSNSTHRWLVFVGDTFNGDANNQTITDVQAGNVIRAYYAEKTLIRESGSRTTVENSATYVVEVTVNSSTTASPKEVSVKLTNGEFTKTEGQYGGYKDYTFSNLTVSGTLHTASLTTDITYNITYSDGALYDINGYLASPYWSDTLYGYGWKAYKNEVLVTDLKESVTFNDKITFYYCPSNSNGAIPNLEADSYGNYLASSLCTIKITVSTITLYEGSVDIVQGTSVPTANGGYSFATDLGVLALSSTSKYGNYEYISGDVSSTYNITSMYLIEATDTHRWIVFKNQQYFGNQNEQPLLSVSPNDVITAFYVEKDETTYTNAKESAQYVVTVTASSISPKIAKSIPIPVLTEGTFEKTDVNGQTDTYDTAKAIGALQAAAALGEITYDISTGYMVSVINIDDFGYLPPNYNDQIGYSWTYYKNGHPSYFTIENDIVQDGDVLTFYYCPNIYSGESLDGFASDENGYIIDSSIHTVEIIVGEAASGTESGESAGPSSDKILWSVDMSEKYANDAELMPDGSPVVHNGKVYVTAWSAMGDSSSSLYSGVYCFDADTGEVIWKSTGYNTRSPITIYGDHIYVGYMDTTTGYGGVKRLNLIDGTLAGDTGNIFYSANTKYAGITSTPLILDGNVWIYSASNTNGKAALYKFDLMLSSWSGAFEVFEFEGNPGGLYSSIAISDDKTKLYVPSGEGIWVFDVETEIGTELVNVNTASYSVGTPIYDDGHLYFMVSGTSGNIYSVDLEADEITATPFTDVHKSNSPTNLIIDNGILYATGSEGLTAYNIETGKKIWWHFGGDARSASPTLAGDVIYYGTYAVSTPGALYAVKTGGIETGERNHLWKFTPDYDGMMPLFEGRPAVADGVLYVGSEGVDTFYAFSDAGTATPDDNTGNNSDTNTDGSTSGGTTYVPPVQTPTVSYTSINPGTGQMTYTTNHPNYPAATFTFDRMTAAGVLLSSGLNVVTAERWGGLYVSSINGKSADNDPTGGWMCQVNGIPISVMMNNYPVSNGDKVVFYYSESMSSSPESSSYVYRFQVSSTAVPQPIPTPTETPVPESFTPAESPQITFQIPTGVTITTTETGKTVSIDTGLIKANDKSTVTVTEQAITITYPGVILTIDLTEYTKKGDLATATLGGMKAYLVPAPVTIPVGGYAV